jgi:hypothetical protein
MGRFHMKKLLSIIVSGAVIAAFSSVAISAEQATGSDLMKKVDAGQEKVVEKGGKAEGKVKDVVKKKDKAADAVKNKKKKVKEIKEGKEKPAEKVTKATDEGDKTVKEVKDLKKEMK